MSLKIAALAAVIAFTGAGAANAQNFTGMDLNAMNNQFMAQQNNAMANQQRQVIQQVLSSPQAMALYPTCGRGLTREQFALKYAATGGCSAQGYANYNNQTNAIGAQQRQSMDQYYRSLEQNRQAYNAYTGGYAANQQEAGRVMQGNQSYYDPTVGRNVTLRYIQPGQTYTDPSSRRTYTMDARGQYWSSNGNGWTAVNPAGRAPR